MAAGRPTSFKPEYSDQASKLCLLGATDVEIADFFKVDVRTVYRWQNQHPEFCQALKVAKSQADERVERSLYHRATGYTFDAVKIFMPASALEPVYAPYREHVPPDTTAMIFWLKNRRPDAWRDKTEHHTFTHSVSDMTDEELDKIIASGSSDGSKTQTVDKKKPH